MKRRGAIKGVEVNANNLLTNAANKELDIESKSMATKSSFEDFAKAPSTIHGKSKQNMYTFKVRHSDKDQIVSFPKEEAMNLACEIGVDLENDQGERLWFLQQALLSELPQGWTREKDFADRTVFYNTLTKEQSSKHPNIYKFRTAFNRILHNVTLKEQLFENSALEMSNTEKYVLQQRLEELDEAERAKLLKTLKVNISKEQEKTAGELTKNIMRWMKEKKNKFGSSEEFPVILDGQSSYYFQSILNEIESKTANFAVGDTEALEEALKEAYKWYSEIIPHKKISCPKNIEQTEAYQFADIEEVLLKAQEFNIDAEAEPYLLWIPRMALALSLPPFWRAKRIEDSLYYYNIERDVISSLHPDNEFMIEYTRKVREVVVDVEGNIFNTSYMNFYDSLMRDFREAFYPLERETKNITMDFSVAASKYSENLENPDSLNPEKEIPEVRPQFYHQKIEITDREIIEIAKQCNVNFKTELYLLSTIEETLKEHKYKTEEVWEFRLSHKSSPYWVSTKSKIASKKYPLLSLILDQISESKKFVQNSGINDQYRLMARIPKKLLPFSSTEGVSGLYQQLKEEANKLVSVAIENKVSESGSPKNKPFDIKKLADFIGTTLSKDEALDVLFACPFDFGREKLKVDSISEESDSSNSSKNSVLGVEEKILEDKSPDQISEQKESKKKLAEQKKSEKKLAEQKKSEKKLAEQKKSEKKLADQKKSDKKASDQLSEQRSFKKEEKTIIKQQQSSIPEEKASKQDTGSIIAVKEEKKSEAGISSSIITPEKITETISKQNLNTQEENIITPCIIPPQIKLESLCSNTQRVGTAQRKEIVPLISPSHSAKSLIKIPEINDLKLPLPEHSIKTKPKKPGNLPVIESILEKATLNSQEKTNSNDIKEQHQNDIHKDIDQNSPIIVTPQFTQNIQESITEKDLIPYPTKLEKSVVLIPQPELDIETPIEQTETPKQKESSPKQPYSIHLPKEKVLTSINQSLANDNNSGNVSKEIEFPSSASDSFKQNQNPKIPPSEFEKFGDVSSICPSLNPDVSLASEPPQIRSKEKQTKREQSNQSPEPQELASSNPKLPKTFFPKAPNEKAKIKKRENTSKFHVLSQARMRTRAKKIRSHMPPPSTMRSTNGYISIQDQNPQPEVESKMLDFENQLRVLLEPKEIGKLVTQTDYHYSSARLLPNSLSGGCKILYRQTDKNWNPNFPADLAKSNTKKRADIFSETNEETIPIPIPNLKISGRAAECHSPPNMYATATQIPQILNRTGCCSLKIPIILQRSIPKKESSLIKRNLVDSEIKVEDLVKIEEKNSIAIQKPEEQSNTPTICSPEERTPQDKNEITQVGILPKISPFCKLISLKNRRNPQNIRKATFNSPKYRPQIKVLFNNTKFGDKYFSEKQAVTDKHLQNGTLLTSFRLTTSEELSHFAFYIKRLGNPRHGTDSLRLYPARPFVSPGHVVALAKRFGVSVYKEPDLMWIFHQFLCAPQPNLSQDLIEETQVEKMVEDILSLKLGKHPSDIYFLYLLHYAHKEKHKELALVSEEEEMYQYLLEKSWLEFRGKESVIAYNFANMRHINRDLRRAEDNLDPKVGIKNKDTMEQIQADFEKAYSLLQNYKVSDYVKHKLHRAKNFLIQDKTNSSSQKNTQIKAAPSLREYARSQLSKFERSLSHGRNPIASSHTKLDKDLLTLPCISETKRSHSLIRGGKFKH